MLYIMDIEYITMDDESITSFSSFLTMSKVKNKNTSEEPLKYIQGSGYMGSMKTV